MLIKSKKLMLTIILIFFFPLLTAQTKYSKYYPTLNGFYDANDSASVTIVDRMNSYNMMQDILYLSHKIEDDADNRIHYEMHVTGGLNWDFDHDTLDYVAGVSVKINLTNPKIPNSHEVINNIHELRRRLAITGSQMPGSFQANMDSVYDFLVRYNRKFWGKRISFGATVPFGGEDGGWAHFDIKETYLFLGYDMGDVITLQLGANLQKKIFVAASADLSTPLYSLAEDFKDMISRLLRIP